MQIVWSSRRGSRSIEHLGSAHDEAEWRRSRPLRLQRLAAGQAELDLGCPPGSSGRRCRSSPRSSAHLWEALCAAYRVLGFDAAAGGDEVFRDLVLARHHRADQQDRRAAGAHRDRGGAGLVSRRSSAGCRCSPNPASGKRFRPHARRMPGWGRPAWCSTTCRPCTSRPMPVTGSGSPGFPRNADWNRRSPSGLLTDAAGFPLTVAAFEGNKAETATMLPVINAFKAAHQLTDVTVVADAGMISEANQVALQAAGLSLHPRRPHSVPARRGARMA